MGERRRLTDALGGWLDQLPVDLTLVICSRRQLEPGRPRAQPAASPLERGRGECLATWLAETPCYRRPVYLAWSNTDQDQARVIPELAVRCGIRSEAVAGPPPLAEGMCDERVSALRVGGRWIGSVRLARLPGVEVEPGWLWTLVGLPAEYDLAIHIGPRGSAAADRELRRRLNALEVQAIGAALAGKPPDPRVESARSGAAQLRQVLATGAGQLYELSLSASLAAPSASELASLIREMRARARGLRAELLPAWFDQAPARQETLGWGLPHERWRRLVTTRELTTLWPWMEGPAPPGPGETLLGHHQRSRLPVGLDLRSTAASNSNLGVVASSGSGKSYLAGLVGMEAVRQGLLVVVVDPENEHRGWVEAVGGCYLDLAVGDSGLNVLELGSPEEAAAAAVDLVGLLCGPLSAQEGAALLGAVAAARARLAVRPPLLSDCLVELEHDPDHRTLAERLRPWVQGQAGRTFNCVGDGPAVGSALGIGIRDLPPDWVPAAALLVSRWLWNWAKTDPSEKRVIVDEAGLLADNPPLRQLMTHLARRLRKYRGSLVVLTQASSDLVASLPGEVVAVNSNWVMLGGQPPSGADRLQRAFALDDTDRQWLEQAGRGSFLLVSGVLRQAISVEAPPAYHRLLTTAGANGTR